MWDQQAIRDFNRSIERTTPVALILCAVLFVNMCGHMVSTKWRRHGLLKNTNTSDKIHATKFGV